MSIEDRQLLDLDKAIGLTIKGAAREYANGHMAFSFSNGQFIILEAECDGDGYALIAVDSYTPDPSLFLVEAGVYTKQEYGDWNRQEVVRYKAAEREHFLRLKAKYEPEEE